MIIAMKGDAYSGKTACADAIAKYYRCPVISFDGILDSLSGPSAPAVDADRLADLAFDVIVRHVKLQLEFGRPTVVDSPLSNRSHLEKLLRLEEQFKSCSDKACGKLHCHFVIVESRPEIEYAWEQRFEMRDRAATDKWYKHDMRLVFGTWEVEEDYICDVCLEPRNDPTAGYYYCDFCKIASHLHCIYRDDI